MLGGPVSELQMYLFDLPAWAGGLEISDSMESASAAFSSSRRGSAVLVAAICGQHEFSLADHLDILVNVQHEA